MWNQVHMTSKHAEKLINMLAKKRKFTEIFPFESYRRSNNLELIKVNEYGFRNQQPKTSPQNIHPNTSKNSLYLTGPKNCVGKCNQIIQMEIYSQFILAHLFY